MLMNAVLHVLQRHPSIGAVSSIGASLASWLAAVEGTIHVLGLVIGVLIGVVTLMLKLNELRRSRSADYVPSRYLRRLRAEDLQRKQDDKTRRRDDEEK